MSRPASEEVELKGFCSALRCATTTPFEFELDRTLANEWPNIPGSGSNDFAPSGFGRLGDSENNLMDSLAAGGGNSLAGGVLQVNSVARGFSSLPPCDLCDHGMQSFADQYGVTIVYTQTGRRGMPVGDPHVYTPTNEEKKPGGCSQ